jgi:hypothetical protein
MKDYTVPTGMLAEALHSTYSIICRSHALEECPYTRSKRRPLDFEAWADRVNRFLSDLRGPTSEPDENRKSDT